LCVSYPIQIHLLLPEGKTKLFTEFTVGKRNACILFFIIVSYYKNKKKG
jgi:hypothetical protein